MRLQSRHKLKSRYGNHWWGTLNSRPTIFWVTWEAFVPIWMVYPPAHIQRQQARTSMLLRVFKQAGLRRYYRAGRQELLR